MKFKITCEVTEDQMMKLLPMAKTIIPQYKSRAGIADIDWIRRNKDIIVDAACDYVWDMYYEAFADKKILSRNAFYKAVRYELGLKSKLLRIDGDTIKYCFTNKST